MTDRTLVIMRHAKAEQSPTKADIDRDLTGRGLIDARAAGAWLAEQRSVPDAVLCSPANRTRQTWQRVLVGLSTTSTPPVDHPRDLYYGGVSAMLDGIRVVPSTVGTLLIVGHNPTVSDISSRLAGQSPGTELRTAGIAVHTFTGEWADCTAAELTRTYTACA